MSKHKRLSYDELRTFPGFENFTDGEAEEVIDQLDQLSILFFELYKKEQAEKEDNKS